MNRPSREETCMEMARVASTRSTCSRLHVGVAFAVEGRVVLTGYNGAPKGMPHCEHRCDCGYPGTGGLLFADKHLSNCAALAPCTVSVHAEANAIAWAARHGVRLEGSELFSTNTACLACAQLLVNVGIVRMNALRPYRDPAGSQLLQSAGIEVVDWALRA